MAVGNSTIAGSGYAFFCVMAGVFITALYSFRMFFMVFHGKERMDEDARHHLHESPWVVTLPLVLLAIPSLVIGWPTIGPMLFGDFFAGAIYVPPRTMCLGRSISTVPGASCCTALRRRCCTWRWVVLPRPGTCT